ncbi:MAG: acyl transferase, partial [Bacteroidota bacterium]
MSIQRAALLEKITQVTEESFAEVALEVFRYQAAYNHIYARYLELLRIPPASVSQMTDIPHLPIALFKKYQLQTGDWQAVRTFTSSGTTGSTTSQHLLRDEEWYRNNARRAFEGIYGPLEGRPVFALLPAYLERSGSSLVFMADDFIKQSKHSISGFF